MVVKVDFTGKTKSEYQCDRCGAKLQKGVANRYRVVVYRTTKYKGIMHWDLCTKCTRALKRGIEKRNTKEVETNE